MQNWAKQYYASVGLRCQGCCQVELAIQCGQDCTALSVTWFHPTLPCGLCEHGLPCRAAWTLTVILIESLLALMSELAKIKSALLDDICRYSRTFYCVDVSVYTPAYTLP